MAEQVKLGRCSIEWAAIDVLEIRSPAGQVRVAPHSGSQAQRVAYDVVAELLADRVAPPAPGLFEIEAELERLQTAAMNYAQSPAGYSPTANDRYAAMRHQRARVLNLVREAIAARPVAAGVEAPPAGPAYAGSFGYSLAMRVMQSDLYRGLDGRERAECDELIRRGQGAAGVPASEVPSTVGAALERSGLAPYIKDGDLAHLIAALRFADLMRGRLPGLETLANVIECLRAEARYVDEEGEATNLLQDLLDALRADGVMRASQQEPSL